MAYDPPHTVQETEASFYPLVAPLQFPFRRSRKKDKQTGRIGAELLQNFFRGNHVAKGLAHLGSVFDDHTLGQQVGKGFVIIYHARIPQYLQEEAGIQQMKDGVFNAADVLVYRTPVAINFFGKRRLIVFRIGITEIIPGGTQEGVHGIRFPGSVSAALGALAVQEAFTGSQGGFGAGVEFDIFRQHNRQFLFRNQHFAAVRAVNDRNGGTPVTLAGNQPVTETVVDAAFTYAEAFNFIADRCHGFRIGHAVKLAAVNHDAVFFIGIGHIFQFQFPVFRLDDQNLGDIVFRGELPVTGVMGRHAHNRAGTVIKQYVVGDPDLDLMAHQGMHAVKTGIHTEFFTGAGSTFNVAGIAHFIAESTEFRFPGIPLQHFFNNRMLRRNYHKGHALDRVGAGRIYGQFFIQGRNIKTEFQTFTAADPVFLHDLYTFRPAGDLLQILQQFIRIIRNFKEPLAQLFFMNFVLAAPAFSVFYLLVGQYGIAVVAPVYGRILFNSQSPFVEQFKEPFRPFIIIRFTGNGFPVPVIGQPQLF